MTGPDWPRIAARVALGICLALPLHAGTIAAHQAQTPSASVAPETRWPMYDNPIFAVLAPVENQMRRPAADVLADLDRLQPQIAASSLLVQGRALLIRGLVLRRLPDIPGAERAATEARAIGQRTGHPYIEFDALMTLFSLAGDRGDLAAASALVAEAVPIADRIDNVLMRFNVRLEQGRILRQRGQGVAALAPLNDAVAIAERLASNVRIHVQALNARSSTKLGLSDYDGALADADRAFALTGAPGSPPDLRAAATFAFAQVQSQIGDLEQGADLYGQAIESYTQASLLVGVALALRQRMDVRFALGDDEGAAADGERARELFVRTGSAGQEPAVLSRLALISARLGRRDQADAFARDAAAKAAGAQPRVRAAVESDLASAALTSGNLADAATRYTRVLDQARALKDPEIEWRALHGLGRAALGTKDLVTAQGRFEAAAGIIDRVRRTLPEAGLRADFVAERLGPYDGLIATLMARSTSPGDLHAARAFETAERARGRALADLLAEAQARLTDPAVARIRVKEGEFGKRLSTLQQSLADAKTDADRRLRLRDLQRAEVDYEAFIVRIRRETPKYGSLAHPRAVTAAEVSRGLAVDEALVSFWVGADRGTAWVLTRNQLRSYGLPGRQTLDREVARLKSAIAGGQVDEVRRLGARLHATLFQGIDQARITRLVVVPDGPLWRAPFAALTPMPASTDWLIQRTAISVVPSASLRASLAPAGASAASRQPALVFGLEQIPEGLRALRALYDPRLLPDRPLLYAVAEARSVAQLVSADAASSVFLNARADETAFKRAAAAPYRVLHVASHALVDDSVPRRSALVLAASDRDDGLLQLNEIANLQLDVDLVVLSTCQSQLGRAVRGEGLVSLSRAFIHSGARAVAASLWRVDDRETAKLMPFFYTALRGGAAPDQALRQAQLQMIQAGGTSAAPASWAGFVLTGRATQRVY